MGAALRCCAWRPSALSRAYDDRDGGVTVREDSKLFECLLLEGARAGLAWDTILKKRERYREVFDGFDPRKVARYGARKKAQLLADPGIVRNRAKIEAAVGNARAFLAVQKEFGSFARYIWAFVGGKPLRSRRARGEPVPARSEISDALSKDLKRRGFKFVGSTIMYAFMQAVGMVDDHAVGCFRRRAAPRR